MSRASSSSMIPSSMAVTCNSPTRTAYVAENRCGDPHRRSGFAWRALIGPSAQGGSCTSLVEYIDLDLPERAAGIEGRRLNVSRSHDLHVRVFDNCLVFDLDRGIVADRRDLELEFFRQLQRAAVLGIEKRNVDAVFVDTVKQR